VCDCSDQAAHYHNLGPKLGASLLTRHIGWKQKKKVKKICVDELTKIMKEFSHDMLSSDWRLNLDLSNTINLLIQVRKMKFYNLFQQ
jgi:hypothetical protein